MWQEVQNKMSKTTKIVLSNGYAEFKNIKELRCIEKELIHLGYIFTVVISKLKLAIYL
jgi:hypothetical protein